MEISRSRNRLKVFFFFIFFLTSCQLSNEARKKPDPEINVLDKFGNIFSAEIYDAYVRTCETLITKIFYLIQNRKLMMMAL